MADRRAVFLVGFMGAGKTTVGRLLAERLGRRFVDTDEVVERTEGRAIEAIFRDDGEGAFRAAEERALLALGAAEGTVVATGGGLFLGAAPRRVLKRLGVVVWLDVSLATAIERVGAGDGRPLWRGDDPIALRVAFDRRRAAYALAHGRVVADGDPETVAREVETLLARIAPGVADPPDP